MPTESLSCPGCGSTGVSEYKPDWYVCPVCDKQFTWIDPTLIKVQHTGEYCLCGSKAECRCSECGVRMCKRHAVMLEDGTPLDWLVEKIYVHQRVGQRGEVYYFDDIEPQYFPRPGAHFSFRTPGSGYTSRAVKQYYAGPLANIEDAIGFVPVVKVAKWWQLAHWTPNRGSFICDSCVKVQLEECAGQVSILTSEGRLCSVWDCGRAATVKCVCCGSWYCGSSSLSDKLLPGDRWLGGCSDRISIPDGVQLTSSRGIEWLPVRRPEEVLRSYGNYDNSFSVQDLFDGLTSDISQFYRVQNIENVRKQIIQSMQGSTAFGAGQYPSSYISGLKLEQHPVFEEHAMPLICLECTHDPLFTTDTMAILAGVDKPFTQADKLRIRQFIDDSILRPTGYWQLRQSRRLFESSGRRLLRFEGEQALALLDLFPIAERHVKKAAMMFNQRVDAMRAHDCQGLHEFQVLVYS